MRATDGANASRNTRERTATGRLECDALEPWLCARIYLFLGSCAEGLLMAKSKGNERLAVHLCFIYRRIFVQQRIFGEDFYRRFLERTFGEDFWRGFLERIFLLLILVLLV